jgi:putative transposase
MTLLNGSKERIDEGSTSHPGAGCPQAQRGRLLGEGQELPEVCKMLEVSEATYHRWRAQFGGMKADDVKRLKELEVENARLKRIVADQTLHIAALNEVSKGNW